jgi:L-ascorbate metabolism protein UlaG (beta-lactamase superfamily)
MNITYLGHSSFLLKNSTGKLVTDPYDGTKMGKKFPKVEADIITISHEHDDHNARTAVEGDPLVITIPGEYEKFDIRVSGFETYHDKQQGEERGKNTIFKIEMDDISILHCGDLGHTLSNELIEEINGADVVLIPVGGFYTIDADEARQVVEKLEATIIIPMHYKVPDMSPEIMNNLAPVDDFLAKIGVTEPERMKTLSLKKADLDENTRIIVLES